MQLSDFNFELPAHLIAHYPAVRRSFSKLLCLDAQTGQTTHRAFHTLSDLLLPGDLLILNDTKVIPARLFGQKQSGGHVEVLVERILDNRRILAQVRVSKPPRIHDQLLFGQQISLEVLDRQNQFYQLCYNNTDRTILDVIEMLGQVPLPPYIRRVPEESDKERYQTIYAKHKGSVAAPTAGFHFDAALLENLSKKVALGYLTLHIGAGTFTPVRAENITDHKMHAEYLEVPAKLCTQIEKTKAAGGRIIAVGTTTMRALETASQGGKIAPYCGETNIFIYPGFEFHCADILITNLHLPRSSLLMLVCAFGGYQQVMNAYREAVTANYRFYSYGDAMWVPHRKPS